MKILHVVNNLELGGAEKLLADVLPIMNEKNGIKADILLLTDNNNIFSEELKKCGININVVACKSLYNPINILHIRNFIIQGSYTTVHVHLFPSFYWVSVASMLIGKNKPKFIFTEHNTYNRRRESKMFNFIEVFIYSNYDKIVSVSLGVKKSLLLWLRPKYIDLKKYDVIENGIDIHHYMNACPYEKSQIDESFVPNVKLVCMVGRFTQQKDQATVIRAMRILPEYIHLLLVGDGELRKENEQLAEKEGVHNRVHFLGVRKDINRILKTSDIAVLSSNWEGFGLAAVEAMAAEIPTIASDVPGLSEVVRDAGILFQRGNVQELSEKILEILTNDEQYRKIANLCAQRAYQFSIDNMIKKYLKIYV